MCTCVYVFVWLQLCWVCVYMPLVAEKHKMFSVATFVLLEKYLVFEGLIKYKTVPRRKKINSSVCTEIILVFGNFIMSPSLLYIYMVFILS